MPTSHLHGLTSCSKQVKGSRGTSLLAPMVSNCPKNEEGADSAGLWSFIRDLVLEKPSPPEPTGDLAYRGTFTREQLEAFNDPGVNELIHSGCTYNWMGHNKHTVFYPVQNATSFNLVLM